MTIAYIHYIITSISIDILFYRGVLCVNYTSSCVSTLRHTVTYSRSIMTEPTTGSSSTVPEDEVKDGEVVNLEETSQVQLPAFFLSFFPSRTCVSV